MRRTKNPRVVEPVLEPQMSPEMQNVFGPTSKYQVKDGLEYPLEIENILKHKEHERPALRAWLKTRRPYLKQIRCSKGRGDFGPGHLYPHSPTEMAFTGTSTRLLFKLLSIPGVRQGVRGDEEFSVVFAPEVLPAVAEVVRPRASRRGTQKMWENHVQTPVPAPNS